jgi:hypothetical protein
MDVKYSYAPDESSHSRSQHAEPVINAGGRKLRENKGGDAFVRLGDGQDTPDTIWYQDSCRDKQHADKNRWLGGTGP